VASKTEPASRKPHKPATEYRRPLKPHAAARWNLTKVLLIGYLTLLALNLAVPLIVVPMLGSGDVTRIRDLMLAMSATIQGLVGLVGIAVAFYFKGTSDK
jgi:hypothetical protein